MKANKFVVSDLKNADKIPEIRQSISSHNGINAVRVDMLSNTVTVDYDEELYSEGDVKCFVELSGLNVTHVK